MLVVHGMLCIANKRHRYRHHFNGGKDQYTPRAGHRELGFGSLATTAIGQEQTVVPSAYIVIADTPTALWAVPTTVSWPMTPIAGVRPMGIGP
jgi:hypothetical protein